MVFILNLFNIFDILLLNLNKGVLQMIDIDRNPMFLNKFNSQSSPELLLNLNIITNSTAVYT